MTRFLSLRQVGILLALGLVVLGTVTVGPRLAAQFRRSVIPGTGYPTPDFTLVSLDGESVSLSAQKGKPVVLVFVASWCEVCRAEMPMMVESYRAHREHDLVVIAVDTMEEREAVARFRDDFQIPFPLLLDSDGRVTARFNVNGTPTTFFIDRDGMTRDIVIGGPLSRTYLEKEIAPLF